MLNEATENLRSGKISTLEINLSDKYPIILVLTFNQVKRKRYIIDEHIKIGDIIIDDQVKLVKLKSFMYMFRNRKLNPTLKNEYFKVAEKTETIKRIEYKKKSLMFNDPKPTTLFLDEIDVYAFLEIWSSAIVGYSKIMLHEQNTVFTANTGFCEFGPEDPKLYYMQNEEVLPKIIESVKKRQYQKEDITKIIEEN